jgi:WD40 repeat protein
VSDWKIVLRDAQSGQQIRIFPAGETDFSTRRSLAFSADSKLLAFIATVSKPATTDSPMGRTLVSRVWDVSSGELVREMAEPGAVASMITFSPDGKSLVVAQQRKERPTSPASREAKVVDLKTGRTTVLPFTGGSLWAVAFSPDGKKLALGGGGDDSGDKVNKALVVWDLEAKQPIFEKKREGDFGAVLSLAFNQDTSANSLLLAVGEGNYELQESAQSLRIIDLDSGKEFPNFNKFGETVLSVAFSPKEFGEPILLSSGQTDRLWKWTQPATSAEDSLVLPGTSSGQAMFTSDGQWLARFTDGGLKLWETKRLNWLLSSPPPEIVKDIRARTALDINGLDDLGFPRLSEDELRRRLGENYRKKFTLISIPEPARVEKSPGQ